MKKVFTILAAVLLFAGLHSKALAQSDASTTTASANVVQSLEVGAESQNLDFGYMLANTQKHVDFFKGVTTLLNDTGIRGGEQRGYISIETAAGSSVDLSLAVPSTLKDESDNSLNIDFDRSIGTTVQSELNGRVSETAPTGSTFEEVYAYENGDGNQFSFNSGTWSLNNSITMPASGTMYLVLGGEVSTNENQPVGNYSGDVTLTATINN